MNQKVTTKKIPSYILFDNSQSIKHRNLEIETENLKTQFANQMYFQINII